MPLVSRVGFREGNVNSIQRKEKEKAQKTQGEGVTCELGEDWTKVAIGWQQRYALMRNIMSCFLATLSHELGFSKETPHTENGKISAGRMWVFICLKENVEDIEPLDVCFSTITFYKVSADLLFSV